MSFGITELLIVLAIVIVIFGAKRIKNLGPDLGSAIKGFRSALSGSNDDEKVSGDDSQHADDAADLSAETNATDPSKRDANV